MEELDFTIKYTFNGTLRKEPLGEDPNDFVNTIEFEVYAIDIHGKLSEVIAKGLISQILFGLAIDYGYPLFDVIEASESILDMSSVLFEFDADKDFWDKLEDYFVDTMPINHTVCYLEYIEIVRNYRGKGIGQKIIKNIIERFYDSCGLWVTKGFPIQYSNVARKKDAKVLDEWYQKMDYDSLEKDFEKSYYKLFHFFQQLGFQNPFDIEYFIAEPCQIIDK